MVQINHLERVLAFIKKHPDSHSSLESWVQIIERNHFNHFIHLRQTFGSVDYVKPYVVFDISGNKYRLITLINYALGLMSVEQILTHLEYDKGKWRK